MRLAKCKMARLNAPRRGQVRTGIYGLNGLGERYIRVQNLELASMADVVSKVMNVEVDFATSQVVFDVILLDQKIDAWDPEEEEGELPDPVELRPRTCTAPRPQHRRRAGPEPVDREEDEMTLDRPGQFIGEMVRPLSILIATIGATGAGIINALRVEGRPADGRVRSWQGLGSEFSHA